MENLQINLGDFEQCLLERGWIRHRNRKYSKKYYRSEGKKPVYIVGLYLKPKREGENKSYNIYKEYYTYTGNLRWKQIDSPPDDVKDLLEKELNDILTHNGVRQTQ